MAADELAPQRAKASAAMVMTFFLKKIPASDPEQLTHSGQVTDIFVLSIASSQILIIAAHFSMLSD